MDGSELTRQETWVLYLAAEEHKQTLKDAAAGFQLAAMNIPQALGYTAVRNCVNGIANG